MYKHFIRFRQTVPTFPLSTTLKRHNNVTECMQKYKMCTKYSCMTMPKRQILPVRSSERSSKTGSDPDLTSLLDLITHLHCCNEDLHTHTHTHTHNRFMALLDFVREDPSELAPER